jgi:predicted dehydrogenase
MPSKRFRVGLVGLQPGRSWAARAHIPALRALSDDFEIAGVANTSLASAEVAAKVSGIARAFANVAELVASPDVDIVAVTVKVPHHLEIVKTALGAGKHVYCEWPLGNGLAEAEEMAALAKAKGLVGVVGTQARVAPEVEYLRKLINDGFVGEVLSTTLTAWGRGWGAAIDSKATGAYLLDRANGATMMTIPLGHTLAALRDVLGDVADVSSVLTTRRKSVLARDTGEMLPMTGARPGAGERHAQERRTPVHSLSLRRGSRRRGARLGNQWHGRRHPWDRLLGPCAQMAQLSLEGGRGEEQELRPPEAPSSYRAGWPEGPVVGNVARVYARMAADLRDGTHTAPRFDDAVAVHRIIAAIEDSATQDRRVPVG